MNIGLQTFSQKTYTLIFTFLSLVMKKIICGDEDYKENVIENEANCD